MSPEARATEDSRRRLTGEAWVFFPDSVPLTDASAGQAPGCAVSVRVCAKRTGQSRQNTPSELLSIVVGVQRESVPKQSSSRATNLARVWLQTCRGSHAYSHTALALSTIQSTGIGMRDSSHAIQFSTQTSVQKALLPNPSSNQNRPTPISASKGRRGLETALRIESQHRQRDPRTRNQVPFSVLSLSPVYPSHLIPYSLVAKLQCCQRRTTGSRIGKDPTTSSDPYEQDESASRRL